MGTNVSPSLSLLSSAVEAAAVNRSMVLDANDGCAQQQRRHMPESRACRTEHTLYVVVEYEM